MAKYTDFSMHRRAGESIAQSYLTNSKRPESLIKGIYPTHIARGHGCYLWDHRGKKYLDFICGLGTNLLGYSNERLCAAVRDWLPNGWSHSLATHLEIETAEKLKELFPFVDCVKFLKGGGQACDAAIRIARAATGRSLVLSDGYHGHGDDFVSLTPPALGIPSQASYPRAIRRLELDLIDNTVAAVILEPVITDYSRERVEYLKKLRELCTKHGALLIFDEVITGFRFPKFSVAGYFGITPDMIVLAKALAGGLPLAVVGGKYAVMNGAEYFISLTYGGETLSLAAAKATMHQLQAKYDLQWLWDRGKTFIEHFNAVAPDVVRIDGYPTRGVLAGEGKPLFMQEACKAGMLFGPSWFYNFPLVDAAKDAMGAIEAIIMRIKNGEVALEGELPSSPFAERVRRGQN